MVYDESPVFVKFPRNSNPGETRGWYVPEKNLIGYDPVDKVLITSPDFSHGEMLSDFVAVVLKHLAEQEEVVSPPTLLDDDDTFFAGLID